MAFAPLIGWLESLADPTRLRMLRLLEKHELGVAELVDALQLPQSTISRHLKVLSEQGWLASRRSGTSHLSVLLPAELDASQQQLWAVARQQTESWPGVRQDELRLDRRLRQRSDESKQFFTGASAAWDATRAALYGDEFNSIAMLSLLPSKLVVADLGCGTGQMLLRLAPYAHQVIGVDNTPAMLETARQRLLEINNAGLQNVELRAGELEALPIDDASCDAALMTLALSYVAEPLLTLREMARILKPSGRAVVVDVMTHDRDDFRREMGQTRLGFSGDELCALMHDAGLSDARARPIAPAKDARGPALLVATAQKKHV